MARAVEEILERIRDLTVGEYIELTDKMNLTPADAIHIARNIRDTRTTLTAMIARDLSVATENSKKIQAIKWFREATGLGLKEAKDFVDGISVRVMPIEMYNKIVKNLAGTGYTLREKM